MVDKPVVAGPLVRGFGRLVGWSLQPLAVSGGGYLALLTGATFLERKRDDPDYSGSGHTEPRFAVVVPAHNEEGMIGRTLRALELLEYPEDRYDVFVVADNCRDATAEFARGHRCTVWERTDPERKAKGYALEWAFERLSGLPEEYDAVVIVDADTVADSALLGEFAQAYRPSEALQALHLQAFESSAASAASYVASALQNCLKPWGRESLGCSAGLNGTGMCVPLGLLEDPGWAQSGLAEDAEFHADLVLSGKRARFVPGARVEAASAGRLRSLQSQRLRWERGRLGLLRSSGLPLLSRALRRRDGAALEAFAAIAAPPLNLTVSAAAGCVASGLVLRSRAITAAGAFGILAPAVATLRALKLAGAPPKVYAYCLFFPPFVIWRTYVSLKSFLPDTGRGWVRTERPGEGPDPTPEQNKAAISETSPPTSFS